MILYMLTHCVIVSMPQLSACNVFVPGPNCVKLTASLKIALRNSSRIGLGFSVLKTSSDLIHLMAGLPH